jgi:hypothetical protein
MRRGPCGTARDACSSQALHGSGSRRLRVLREPCLNLASLSPPANPALAPIPIFSRSNRTTPSAEPRIENALTFMSLRALGLPPTEAEGVTLREKLDLALSGAATKDRWQEKAIRQVPFSREVCSLLPFFTCTHALHVTPTWM